MIANRTYGVIYADPPWPFRTYSAKGNGRSAIAHYDTMTLDAICDIPVAQHAAVDCALFLWVTKPLLVEAGRVIEAWGFTYKTVAFTWVKTNARAPAEPLMRRDFAMGCGYWTRANPEMCLLATRGHPKARSHRVRELIIAPRRQHSRKPDEAYSRIEELCAGPYLEMFARTTRPGWDAWGDQVGLLDGGPVLTRRFPSVRKRRGCGGPEDAALS